MPKFAIKYSGSGNCENCDWEIVEAKDREDALNQAYDLARYEFDSYGGLHGIGMSLEDFISEGLGETEEDWNDWMEQETDSWIDVDVGSISEYIVQEVIPDLQGTCKSLYEILESHGLVEEDLSMDDFWAIDNELFCCEVCGWWCERSEEHEEVDQTCESCVE